MSIILFEESTKMLILNFILNFIEQKYMFLFVFLNG